jgi:hypothetical protein
MMTRDGYPIFDSDTHVGLDAAILSNYLSASEKDRSLGRLHLARPGWAGDLHEGVAPLSPAPRRRRSGYGTRRLHGRLHRRQA